MSDFEKDNELREKYSDVMGSIADDIRQINLDEKTEERHFEFEAGSDEFDAAPIKMSEQGSSGGDAEFELVGVDEAQTAAAESEEAPEVITSETFAETDGEAIPAETEPDSIPVIEANDIHAETGFEPDLKEALSLIGAEAIPNEADTEAMIAKIENEALAEIGAEMIPNETEPEVLEVEAEEISEVPSAFENADSDLDILSCEQCSDMLCDYVSDALDKDEAATVEAHLKNCENCRLEYYEIKDMIGVLSSSKAPEPPVDFAAALHSRLTNAVPEVKAEYAKSSEHGIDSANIIDKVRGAFATAASKINHVIKHANWRIVAPAALSAVLVLGVAGSGIYQVMKSSDEIYDFSDNAAIAGARATARPSSSGLDDYVTGSGGSSSRSTQSPRSTESPTYGTGGGSTYGAGSGSTYGGYSGSTVPRVTARPSTSTSSSGLPSVSSSTRSGSTYTSPSTSSRTTGTTSSSNRTTSSGTTTSRTTTSSSSTARAASPTPTPTKRPYVTPRIILPDIASGVTSPTYVAPETVTAATPEPFVYVPIVTPEPEAAAAQAAEISGEGNAVTTAAPVPTATPKATAAPKPTDTPKQSSTPKTTATPAPTSTAKPGTTAAPAATLKPGSNKEADRKRSADGETAEYTEKAKNMANASVITCEVTDKTVLDEIMNSSLADCSKIDKNGEITLYFGKDDYQSFTDYMKEKNLSYSLVSLGSGDDVKVTIKDSTKK